MLGPIVAVALVAVPLLVSRACRWMHQVCDGVSTSLPSVTYSMTALHA
jgi:hypothetical protein